MSAELHAIERQLLAYHYKGGEHMFMPPQAFTERLTELQDRFKSAEFALSGSMILRDETYAASVDYPAGARYKAARDELLGFLEHNDPIDPATRVTECDRLLRRKIELLTNHKLAIASRQTLEFDDGQARKRQHASQQ